MMGEIPGNLVRIVSLRKGKLKPTEFRLRQGEAGLSLFALTSSPAPRQLVDAVKVAGKEGELGIAILSAADIRTAGLVLRRTPGGTSDSAVNAVHFEACLPWWRKLMLFMRRRSGYDFFNETICLELWAAARLLPEGDWQWQARND